jgi:hypothetical protein
VEVWVEMRDSRNSLTGSAKEYLTPRRRAFSRLAHRSF